ncbi:MAG: hypothetical protein GY856_53475 [bacterium]|nr:hypothetical protein [bacterium]
MIQLERDRSRVPGGLRGHHLVKKNLKLLELKREKGQLSSTDFKTGYWKPAKDQLRTETHGKCAYCEASVKAVAHGDVEHYRPKTVYWWLAYCYDNYLYSCQLCNQTYKSNHFPRSGPKMRGPTIKSNTSDQRLEDLSRVLTPDPVAAGEGYQLARYFADCAAEKADLADPYTIDPSVYLAYQADPGLREVKVVPRAQDARTKKIVEALEKRLGLNREELRGLRWAWYEMLDELRRDLAGGVLPPARVARKKELVREFLSGERPFTSMARYFVEVEWQLDVGP